MVIPELSVKVRNDETNHRANERFTEDDTDNQTNQHGCKLVGTPHQQMWRFIDSSWNSYRLHKPPLLSF